MILGAVISWAVFVGAGIVVGVTLWRNAKRKREERDS